MLLHQYCYFILILILIAGLLTWCGKNRKLRGNWYYTEESARSITQKNSKLRRNVRAYYALKLINYIRGNLRAQILRGIPNKWYYAENLNNYKIVPKGIFLFLLTSHLFMKQHVLWQNEMTIMQLRAKQNGIVPFVLSTLLSSSG